eukprot:403335676
MGLCIGKNGVTKVALSSNVQSYDLQSGKPQINTSQAQNFQNSITPQRETLSQNQQQNEANSAQKQGNMLPLDQPIQDQQTSNRVQNQYETFQISKKQTLIQDDLINDSHKAKSINRDMTVTSYLGTTKLQTVKFNEEQLQKNDKISNNKVSQNLEQNQQYLSSIDRDKDDDYIEPTAMPDINRRQKTQKYVTNKHSAPQDNYTLYQVPNNNFNPKKIEDFEQNYQISSDNQSLSVKEIFDKYKKDFIEDEEEKVILRSKENQTILQKKPVVYNLEEELMIYLQTNSKQYQNIIGVSEIAQGGECIVFRLDYAGVDEVVIKKSVINIDKGTSEIKKQILYTGMISETQQLKFLQSDKYIAKIKEEIIEYDLKSSLVDDYLVIVERARFSLNDILKIWNDEDLRSRYYEYYSPEKLAYYFYQAIQIMAYLHQRDVYYGDMKPHNLLVFKDQILKVGDLGISMKLDNSIPNDQKAYFLKGLSLPYASQKTINDFQRNIPQSRQELIEADIHSLISTFQQCISKSINLESQSINRSTCQDILNDLISSKNLKGTLKNWSKNFMQNQSFVLNLITQMKDENKFDAIYQVLFLTKYKLILEGQLLPIIQDCEYEKITQKAQTQIGRLDKLNNYYEIDDFIQFDKSLPQSQTEALMLDLNFKQLILDILSSLKQVQDGNGQSLNESKIIYLAFEPYFSIQGKLKLEKIEYYEDSDIEQLLIDNENHFYQYIHFQIITKQDKEVLILREKLFCIDQEFVKRKKFYFPLKLEWIRTKDQNNSDKSNEDRGSSEYSESSKSGSDYSQDEEFPEDINKNLEKIHYQNSVLPYFGKPLKKKSKTKDKIIQNLQRKFKIDIVNLSNKKDFFTNNYVNIAFLYIDQLKQQNKFDEAMQESQIWLQKYRDLCGDSHQITLQFFGIVGELLLRKDLKKGIINQQGINYLIKFSKLNLMTYTHFLLLLEALKLQYLIPKHFPPFYNLINFDKELYTSLLNSVFLGLYDEVIVIKTLNYINEWVQKIEEKEFKDKNQFEILMRYLESIEVTSRAIKFEHKTVSKFKGRSDGITPFYRKMEIMKVVRQLTDQLKEYQNFGKKRIRRQNLARMI